MICRSFTIQKVQHEPCRRPVRVDSRTRGNRLRPQEFRETSLRTRRPFNVPPISGVLVYSSGDDQTQISKQISQDEMIIAGGSAALTLLSLSGIVLLPAFDDVYFDLGLSGGDLVGALLWSVSYYFCSPVQLLLLFLGRIETERPSDFVMRVMGKLLGYDIDGLEYEVPVIVRVSAVVVAILWGVLTAVFLEFALGDATWSVSTGFGACFAAGVYEIGRPKRLSRQDLMALESQWQDFKEFADACLSSREDGRVFETEVFDAFRRRSGKYRTQESLSDARLRDMIKNWNPKVSRSRTGWYKNLSFKRIGPEGPDVR